mmetsp:Transcript_19501/g.44262  ORF Transcript_19501/g.44262 Transcript_19501/m.44262 type:complete len:193 (+) Transcript_19501:197-775(+)|eukprot:CAMPEP_0172596732 /NCGR_PEP_ID=MMETSP1068-20121228/16569_1 /TAXON_ID=35684 /ORGANISM="Pseudopedinella elastica, Strain CCMP716" /LENGTH=192 /DNA_ID=CAMNT_0013395907 /DNA_START=190 /DNA_END=768 /DNA_ORIENTATION=-
MHANADSQYADQSNEASCLPEETRIQLALDKFEKGDPSDVEQCLHCGLLSQTTCQNLLQELDLSFLQNPELELLCPKPYTEGKGGGGAGLSVRSLAEQPAGTGAARTTQFEAPVQQANSGGGQASKGVESGSTALRRPRSYSMPSPETDEAISLPLKRVKLRDQEASLVRANNHFASKAEGTPALRQLASQA